MEEREYEDCRSHQSRPIRLKTTAVLRQCLGQNLETHIDELEGDGLVAFKFKPNDGRTKEIKTRHKFQKEEQETVTSIIT